MIVLYGLLNSNDTNIGLTQENEENYYNLCMAQPYYSTTTVSALNNLTQEYGNYNISIYFTEINNEYTYTLNEDKTYYSASIIKLLAASYLIDYARDGIIDLNDTVTYTKSMQRSNSTYMQEYSIGSEVNLKTLITYAISASDNSAYYMLMSYITPSALNEYAKSLDITLNVTNSNYFVYTNVTNTNKWLLNTYNLIQIDDEYTALLTEAMDNTYVNYLNFDNITFLHKYGLYDTFFHELGIYNDNEYPYLISILTQNVNYQEIVNEISKKIYNIYYENLQEKEEYCNSI